MDGYKMFQVVPGVTEIEDTDTSIYVIEGETSAMVIDTGYGCLNLKEAVKEITKKPLIVVCTHGHIDHAFGAHYFDKAYISKDDISLYEEHKQIKFAMKDDIKKRYNLTDKEVQEWCESNAALEFISAGKTFDIGGNILEVISLRGHTPGSIGILDRKHRILFSGDGIISHVWMQLGESTTLAEYLETVKEVKGYRKDFDNIYMGHRNNENVSFIDELENALKDILSGCTGRPYDNQFHSGLIYKRGRCEVVYNPERIR
ncbi:glyoxylase-like metal-dependent hydrolase (beta-lactamase superfamily II) [Ruminiclostridium sufflavum DSM 19573]|uniref:Glyoxylase-like metal-dependent hydrolase (Beta-lactamase superfamily II) n=1 Tax=Ruminiclostridium sufflavum DSM 19573 TaxID=1121337 RepID=A0A318XPK1_9FIRM|nr:MBL fold metallo-hydrolase [Ruminiclostridium sufflavum]PYG87609.1 glyoxylase-like metal-dependent hydrolase (beta-lactamase superfamily II) [Ruminiclostridium sufflavum DSM 19573]